MAPRPLLNSDEANFSPSSAHSPDASLPIDELATLPEAASGDAAVEPRASADQRLRMEAEALPVMDIVYAVARRMVGDEARAEDLVQETYLRAFRSQDQYKAGTNCKAWLLTILRSVYIDSTRHTQARGGSHEQLPHDIQAGEDRRDLAINPEQFMNVLDLMVDDDIRDAMLSLQDLYREAFVMVVIGELPYKEAAVILNVQEGTVKSRVFRACQLLKGRLWRYAVDRRITKTR